MSAELTFKLLSRLNGKNAPTPTQIQRYLDKSQTIMGLDIKLGADIPAEITEMFISRAGGYDGERLKRFKLGVTKARECYGEKALSFLTPRCIRKNGTINFGRLRKNLKAQKS